MIVRFDNKMYKKDGRSNDGLGILCFDIFKHYLGQNIEQSYLNLSSIFNPLHKEFNSKKKVIFNTNDFNKWHDDFVKKNTRYFKNPIKHNTEFMCFTTQWGNKKGD